MAKLTAILLLCALVAGVCHALPSNDPEKLEARLVEDLAALEQLWIGSQGLEPSVTTTEEGRHAAAKEWMAVLGYDVFGVVAAARAELLANPDRYNTSSHQVTMRDGVQLYTVVSFPSEGGPLYP